MGPFRVGVLGVSSAMPLHGRHHSAQWVTYGKWHFLIDCGESTQNRLLALGLRIHRLEGICISHLHADHVSGLPGLLTTLHMQGRQKPLYLWGPPGLQNWIEAQLASTRLLLRYPLYIYEALLHERSVVIWESAELQIQAFPLYHGVPTLGYRFQELQPPQRMDTEKLSALGLSPAEVAELRQKGSLHLKGRTIQWEEFLITLPRRSYAYCSDTAYAPSIATFVAGATVLYHEATFLAAHAARARSTWHSTAQEAAQIAQAAGVQRLYLGHFSTRYKDLQPFLAEARSIFPETHLAEEGQFYPIL
ncbi:MAG: ribonuclease Z [Bacteroidia bacterium]|nr:ribonuclease Z [Bacteroidia bacterium]MDW8088541.1 ribonuclease Z [Bacteroidia bacterium]